MVSQLLRAPRIVVSDKNAKGIVIMMAAVIAAAK
jgi:hypothetical protein